MGLAVAVTGPTGEIGKPLMAELERRPEVGEVLGMARRPFDPSEEGWEKVVYRRGDILDRGALAALFDGVDVAVHLAFAIFGSREETRKVNLQGTRNVFEAAIKAGVKRLVYASSVAAYGFHPDNPQPLTEDVPARGSESFYYSAQKAELEGLLDELLLGSSVDAYVFRPCIVAGPRATMLVEQTVDAVRVGDPVPLLRKGVEKLPLMTPILPDPGVPMQLVHHDDVARAMAAAICGDGPPGVYNLAGQGEVRISDIASALGWRSVPVPRPAVGLGTAAARRLSFASSRFEWASAADTPVLMDSAKAEQNLGWRPRHDAQETLRETVASAREKGLLD
ncbi:MAG: NAD-dependent epimerase/dehydratase family protein [Actinobacteria bacterium]|nr:MAG: NAD-dependent epimerase/dehydratase family protein [Actinomycetota bacterium]